MTIRVIFAPLTGGKADDTVFATAAAVAKRFNAHVDTTFLRTDPRDAIPYMGEGISGALVDESIQRAEEENVNRSHKARSAFDAWRDREAITLADAPSGSTAATCSWREIVGNADQNTEACGRLADLVIASRDSSEGTVENEVAFEAALLHSGRPLLLASPTPRSSLGDRIMIAWNGSAESARAVGAAMPFLKAAGSVTVVTGNEGDLPGPGGDELKKYLAWHGVSSQTRVVEVNDRPVGEVLLEAATDSTADMLVMGAYSHSRLREYIFGGVTRYILDEGNLPVFMAH
ncbi:MAG: universal stress protein [Alphaproteobacteria bacterium]